MTGKITIIKYTLATILCSFVLLNTTVGQGVKKSPANISSVKAGKAKGPVKGTITADMDCSVTINGTAKPIVIKAGGTASVLLKIGDNTVEAIATGKKSLFKNIVKVEAGETPRVEVAFLASIKFLEYIKQGNAAMVEASIKKNPLLATNEGEFLASPPIEIAIENSQLDIIKLLISKGASYTLPTAIFPLHKSILYASSEKSDKEKEVPDRQLVDYFLSQGCKITDKDTCGNTPLHSAAQAGKLDLLTYLIEKGADVNAKNDLGETPLKIAEDKGYISIINHLKPQPVVGKLQAEGTEKPAVDTTATTKQ
jgi:hypothetical protein